MLAIYVVGSAALLGNRKLGAPRNQLTHAYIILTLLRLTGDLLIAYTLWVITPALLPGDSVMAGRILSVALGLSATFQLFIDLARHQLTHRSPLGAITACVLGCILLGSALYIRSCPAGALVIGSPLHSKCKVIAGGRTHLTNYHHDQPRPQNYAVDLVREVSGDAIEGEQVYAPTIGRVDRISTDTSAAEGNLIILRTPDGTEIWLAHLQDDSIRVNMGHRVGKGQLLARLGSTGSAVVPHLHIHAQRNEVPVPLLFGTHRRFPIRGDLLAP